MTCRHDVKRVTIDESLLKDDKDMLEDLVAAAMNDAVRRVESTVQEKMGGVTAGCRCRRASRCLLNAVGVADGRIMGSAPILHHDIRTTRFR